jgi:hypothetical protein
MLHLVQSLLLLLPQLPRLQQAEAPPRLKVSAGQALLLLPSQRVSAGQGLQRLSPGASGHWPLGQQAVAVVA